MTKLDESEMEAGNPEDRKFLKLFVDQIRRKSVIQRQLNQALKNNDQGLSFDPSATFLSDETSWDRDSGSKKKLRRFLRENFPSHEEVDVGLDHDEEEIPADAIHSTSRFSQYNTRQTGQILPTTTMEQKLKTYFNRKIRNPRFESVFFNHRYSMQDEFVMASYDAVTNMPANNATYRNWLRSLPDISFDFDVWFMFSIIGLLTGILGFLLHQIVEVILDFKWHTVDHLIIREYSIILVYLFLGSFSSGLALLASIVIVYYRPSAQGSGMPELIAYLNGTMVKKILSLRTLFAKFVSCVFAVSASLPVGPEGPMIHMGAIIGNKLAECSILCDRFERFRTTEHQRKFITAGAAAGIASAFSAPIGGLLFAMEEVTSFWDMSLGWRVFFCCMISSVVCNLLNSSINGFRYTDGFGLLKTGTAIMLNIEFDIKVHLFAVLPTMILGSIGGVLGALFTVFSVAVNRKRTEFYKRIKKVNVRNGLKVAEPVIIALVTITLTVFTPLLSGCEVVQCEIPEELKIQSINQLKDRHLLDAFKCRSTVGLLDNGTIRNITMEIRTGGMTALNCRGYYNPVIENEVMTSINFEYNNLGSITFQSGFNTVRTMFKRNTVMQFAVSDLIVVLVIYYTLAIVTAGTNTSTGLVIPMMYIGSIYGRMFGKLLVYILGLPELDQTWWDPGAMALLGSVSFFAGVSRLSLSLTVMMMEMTNDIHFLPLIMIVIICAKCVGDRFTHPYYHAQLEARAIPFLHWLPMPFVTHKRQYLNLDLYKVMHIMSTPVLTLHAISDVKTLSIYLMRTTFSGFPVVTDDRTGSYIGLVTRTNLVAVLANLSHVLTENEDPKGIEKAFKNKNYIFRPNMQYPEYYKLYRRRVNFPKRLVTSLHEQCKIKTDNGQEKVRNFKVDLSPFVNSSALSVNAMFSLHRGYSLLRHMGARHMTVVNHHNQVVGIVTRKDVIGSHVEDRISENWENAEECDAEEAKVKGGMFSADPNPMFNLYPHYDFITRH